MLTSAFKRFSSAMNQLVNNYRCAAMQGTGEISNTLLVYAASSGAVQRVQTPLLACAALHEGPGDSASSAYLLAALQCYQFVLWYAASKRGTGKHNNGYMY
jgi:hypothetical protein